MRIVIVIAIAAAVLVPAAAASAAQVSYNGSVLTYTAASGEANAPIVTTNPYELFCDTVPAPCVEIFDPYAAISVPAGKCVGGGGTDVLSVATARTSCARCRARSSRTWATATTPTTAGTATRRSTPGPAATTRSRPAAGTTT